MGSQGERTDVTLRRNQNGGEMRRKIIDADLEPVLGSGVEALREAVPAVTPAAVPRACPRPRCRPLRLPPRQRPAPLLLSSAAAGGPAWADGSRRTLRQP